MPYEMSDYPKKAQCGNCGQTIWVHLSSDKKKEYTKDVETRVGTEWHPCKNWKAGVKYFTEEQQQSEAIRTAAEKPREQLRTETIQRTPPTAQQLSEKQSGLKVSKITIEYTASKSFERTKQVQQFEPEKKGEFNALKLAVEIDVQIYKPLEVENITKDYTTLLRNNVKKELGL